MSGQDRRAGTSAATAAMAKNSIGASCRWRISPTEGRGRAARYTVGAHLVGSPALGPAAFMHRASARDNPQAPLTHY